MQKEDIQKKKIPDMPGVYFFLKTTSHKPTAKNTLYVGKATSLRDRVRSYFTDGTETRGPLIAKMLEEAEDIAWRETDSVLEALVLEATLIKKYQPPYNVREKSDKSFNYVVITKEKYPRVLLVRGKELAEDWDESEVKYSFGPFPHGSQLREALTIVRKIFPYRGEKDPVESGKKQKSYLRRELGLAPDFSKVSAREYGRTIQHLRLLFEGKKKKLITQLEKEMGQYAKRQEFEKAEQTKRQIHALKHVRDVSLIKQSPTSNFQSPTSIRIEAYDIAHTSEQERVGVMAVSEDGRPQKGEYRKFRVKKTGGGDTGALREVLRRRFKHDEWQLPKLIVVDGGKAQVNVAESVLKEFRYEISVVGVVKRRGHKPQRVIGVGKYVREYERDILLANSEAHRFAVSYHRARREKM